MTKAIGAIPTEYAGHLFRSRLEARWAVFFTELGIAWQYEPQGYYVGGLYADQFPRDPRYQPRRYLPDFYLPATGTWVEVKGAADAFDWQLLADAVDWGRGLPGIQDSAAPPGSVRGLMLLGSIPNVSNRPPAHPILQHHKGGVVDAASFVSDSSGIPLFVWGDGGVDNFDSSSNQGLEHAEEAVRLLFPGEGCIPGVPLFPRVRDAYRAARSARFEHGQSGGVL